MGPGENGPLLQPASGMGCLNCQEAPGVGGETIGSGSLYAFDLVPEMNPNNQATLAGTLPPGTFIRYHGGVERMYTYRRRVGTTSL